jgi:hypothetical protein
MAHLAAFPFGVEHGSRRYVEHKTSPYSITSSARSSIDGGMARPSAVAILRFTTISNLVGN